MIPLREDSYETATRLVAMAALAAFCAFHWANLVEHPPVARVVAVLAIVAATAWGLAHLASSPRPDGARALKLAGAAALAIVGLAAGLIAIGLPARLLVPAGWAELGDGIATGIKGVGDVSYPYEGDAGWPRLVLLLALPALLGLGVTLAFWPARRGSVLLRWLGLGVFVATFAMAVVLYAPAGAAAHGFILLVLVGAWLWAPRLAGPRLALGAGALVAAGALAVPVAGALDRSSPILNYREWTWAGGEPTVGFDWNHSYDPLDWPRDGTPMLDVRSDAPHYWRAAVVERFDGFRWVRADPLGIPLELPAQVEGTSAELRPAWVEEIEVTVRGLRSALIVGPGSALAVEGVSESIGDDGTVLAGEIPNTGETYSLSSYAPDPTATQMRRAAAEYPPALARFTSLEVPTTTVTRPRRAEADDASPVFVIEPVTVPLRGEARNGAGSVIARSGYEEALRLSRRLTAQAPTAYDAVKAVENHFQQGFSYTESPPPGGDLPLHSFLFEDRAGYCQQFSGSMALLLRMSGIPARVVSGFSPGAADGDDAEVFTVRDIDAHSWVEVYFTGIGWVTFDPTPGDSPATSQFVSINAGPTASDIAIGPDRRAREPKEAGGGAPAASGGSGGGLPWGALGLVLALAAAGLLAEIGRRRLRYRSLDAADRAAAQIEELAGAIRSPHQGAGPSATLLTLERRLRRAGRRAAADYASGLRAWRYASAAGAAPDLGARRRVRRELGRNRGLRGRLRALRAMPPGGPGSPAVK